MKKRVNLLIIERCNIKLQNDSTVHRFYRHLSLSRFNAKNDKYTIKSKPSLHYKKSKLIYFVISKKNQQS